MKVSEVLTKSEIHDLVELSDLQGWLAVLTSWIIISAAFAVVAFYPTPWAIFIALVLIGGRFLALAILMHDTSHYSLFKTRWLNDWVGKWICGAPGWQDLKRYRKHHLAHHQFAGTERDPDLTLISSFPISRASMLRKIIRDLSGLSGLKRLYGLVLMDLGFIQYTVAGDIRPISQEGRTKSELIRTGIKNLFPPLFTNFILILILWAVGHPWLYLLWLGAYLTSFSLIIRIRSIAEHACTGFDLSPLINTRTTYAGPLARVTVAPHRVNYHLEHHILMTVPYFQLPKMHQMLMERGALKEAHIAKSYLEVLKLATSSKRV